MALDISRLKQSLHVMENPKEARKSNGDNPDHLVKLPKGDFLIRFAPYKFEKAAPFRELHFHYGIGKKSILCPKRMDGEACPICEFAYDVWNNYKATGDESIKETFKAIMPKLRVYAPIVVKSSTTDQEIVDSSKLKFWGMAQKTYEEIITEIVAADAEGVDVTDVKAGLDFTVKMVTTMGRNDRFQVSGIKSARKPTALIPGTAKDIEALINTCPDINEVFKPTPTKEIEEALESFVDPKKSERDSRNVSESKSGSVKDFSSINSNKDEDRNVEDEIDKKFKMLEEESEGN